MAFFLHRKLCVAVLSIVDTQRRSKSLSLVVDKKSVVKMNVFQGLAWGQRLSISRYTLSGLWPVSLFGLKPLLSLSIIFMTKVIMLLYQDTFHEIQTIFQFEDYQNLPTYTVIFGKIQPHSHEGIESQVDNIKFVSLFHRPEVKRERTHFL